MIESTTPLTAAERLREEPAVDELLLAFARRVVAREFRLRDAIGDVAAADFDREEHLAAVNRLLAEAGVAP